jgi:hypothetical protein
MMRDNSIILPESVQAELDAMRQSPDVRTLLNALTKTLLDSRKKAIDERAGSGLEDVWQRCEENYHSVDSASPSPGSAMLGRSRWIKPPSTSGGLRDAYATRDERDIVGSSVFVRLTARYVDAGTAKITEILLSTDEKSFSVRPTPRPELTPLLLNDTQLKSPQGIPLERNPYPEEMPVPAPGQPPQTPDQAQGKPLTPRDLAQEALREAEKRARKMETRIYDWLVEGHFKREMRRMIHDAGRLGVGVLKGPYPERRTARVLNRTAEDSIELIMQEKVAPAFKRINPWNFFPDPACGERIENGAYCWERDFISEKQLADLKSQPGYLAAAIDQVIEEGPNKKKLDDLSASPSAAEDSYAIWYYHGFLSHEQVTALNDAFGRDERDPLFIRVHDTRPQIYAIVSMVNDTVIHAVAGPSETGKLPYRALPWQPRSGSWAGIGVGEQAFVPQDMVNAATRAMLDNAGKSAGSIIAIDRSQLEPADKSWTLTRDKIFYTLKDSINDDVRKAITIFELPIRTTQLMSIIEYGFRLAEESTSIPLVTQGHSGKTTPDTYGAAQLQNSNANQLLRSIAMNCDDYVTEPIIEDLHEWALLDTDIPMDEKDDFQIQAHGSVALVERAIQDQSIQQLGPLVMNPVFGLNPKLWIAEVLRRQRVDPGSLQYTEEEQRRIESSPPPPPPQVQAAQIRAEVDLQRAKMELDRDTAFVQAESERTRIMAEGKARQLQLEYQLELAKYANEQKMTLDEAKTNLAIAALKMRTQERLAKMRVPGQVTAPPTEPPGKAPDGEAFQA